MTSEIRISLFLKSVLTFIVLFFFLKTVTADESKFWAYVQRFVNKSPYEYHVYQDCSPSPYAQEVVWTRLMRLLPYNSKKPLDSVGFINLLLKDAQGKGCTIKLEPSEESKENGAQTYYIKAGRRASGNCLYDWADGPHDIVVSPVLFQLFDEYAKEYEQKGKKILKDKFRYCGYQNSHLTLEILDNGISFSPWHRSYVLDIKVSKLEEDLGEENENKN